MDIFLDIILSLGEIIGYVIGVAGIIIACFTIRRIKPEYYIQNRKYLRIKSSELKLVQNKLFIFKIWWSI
ncbi:MAG: hypothetical protein JEZ05_08855 [Tenericutes bacterium]|nr:hypothetical protein [Mycoplasmatota bacterium]